MEQWKKITEFPDYQVSNQSRVKNKHGQILIPFPNQKEYLRVRFTINKKVYLRSIYRLSAIEFIPNPLNLPQVNHIDGDKTNNQVSNLEWCSNKYNQIHRFKVLKVTHGSKGYKQRKDNPKSRKEYNTRSKKVDQFDMNDNYLKTFNSLTEAHNSIGTRGIWNCLQGKRKSCGGFKWKLNINQT